MGDEVFYTPIELAILDDAAEDEEDAIDSIMGLDDENIIDVMDDESCCNDDEDPNASYSDYDQVEEAY